MNHLYQTADIYRSSKDTSKSYTTFADTKIGTYPCRISRQSVQTARNIPNETVQGTMRCYLNMDADIKRGDRLECEDTAYSVMYVYKPGGHHIEADIKFAEVDV